MLGEFENPLELGSRSRRSNLVDPSKRRGQTGLDETAGLNARCVFFRFVEVAFWVVGEDRLFVRFVCLVVFVCLIDLICLVVFVCCFHKQSNMSKTKTCSS